MWTLTLLVALSLVASVLANYGVVGPGAPSGEVPTIAHRLVARQAATFTGCTCLGWQYIPINPPGPRVQVLAGFGQAIPGFTQTNQRGWCWQNGAILPDENTETLNALSSGTNTYRVNGPYIRKYCDGQQLGLTNTQCIARLFRDYYNDLTANNLFTACVWPTSNFVPLDCNCRFQCLNGYVACGRQCINPATQQCVSGLPQPRRRSLSTACPQGYHRCPLPQGGFECVDVNNDLESCGGCPGYGDDSDVARGVDCSELPGVAAVACVRGECLVDGCLRRHRLVDGACVPV